MTQPRREWVQTFADPALLSDLRAAIVDMARTIDACDPEECMHDEAMVHPIEVFHWIECEVQAAKREPVRFERGHRPKARNGEGLTLAVAVG